MTEQDLTHRRAIEDLLIDYCRHLDSMDLKRLAGLFTDDCRVVYGDDPRLRAEGRKALEASLARMWRWRRTAHHLSNVRIWVESRDQARSESSVWAWHEAADGTEAQVFGLYHDVFRHTGTGWRIAERRMTMQGSSGAFRVPLPAAHRAPSPDGWEPPEGLDG